MQLTHWYDQPLTGSNKTQDVGCYFGLMRLVMCSIPHARGNGGADDDVGAIMPHKRHPAFEKVPGIAADCQVMAVGNSQTALHTFCRASQPPNTNPILPVILSMASFRHITLQSHPGALLPRFPSYAFASSLQTVLQQEFLGWKARPPGSRGPPPPPSIICFTPTPTYTLGRRQTEPLSGSDVARLRSPLFMPTSRASDTRNGHDIIDKPARAAFFLPTIAHAPRGGLTTYHGPGQLVIWPVIDLHSPLHAHLSVREYACLLEKTTIAALEKCFGLHGFTTENPGVWVRDRGPERMGAGGEEAGGERKIAALGVHLRRHVTGLGVAINYSTPVLGYAETNPWSRIVACGIGDRQVTSVCSELGLHSRANVTSDDKQALGTLAEVWELEFRTQLKLRKHADNMPAMFDMTESMEGFRALVKDRDDFLVEAYPIRNLET
ncbi:hypothetical protein GQX73_g6960 [Xylaria multiplex]|uniref:BPL/LPL catalytic domain-containing protein n=1 Tax=Xylaria multiplex TaxID=323545 RepID=A0A7C8MS24_9PEZI|nr:hypothetical protein GQX73_g6960 [Xylaria multiplex]